MDLKYLALIAMFAGVSLVVYAVATTGEGAQGVDRLPLTAVIILGGGGVAAVSGIYLLVRAFMAL